jgi:hypothetical protein
MYWGAASTREVRESSPDADLAEDSYAEPMHRPNRCNIGITASAATGASAQNSLKSSMVMPMTGALAAAGRQVVAGARLNISQHGNRVAGRQIELLMDHQGRRLVR